MSGYPLMESFYTLQGEGANSGRAAWFIRLGGCDVGCVWCDVKDSWDASIWPLKSAEELSEEALLSGAELVVITGGEPAMYDLTALCEALKQRGLEIAIETSGAHPLIGHFDWITFSPKKFKAPMREMAYRANELKVIVFNQSDFQWAEEHASLVGDNCMLYLQPEYDRMDRMLPDILKYVKGHPRWRVSLQTHKWLGID